jgi:hypothetical protein
MAGPGSGSKPDWLSWQQSPIFHPAVFIVAVSVFAAIAAATGAGLAAPSLLGRNLASYELLALAAAFGVLAWGLTASRRRRERKRMLGMRDSALW